MTSSEAIEVMPRRLRDEDDFAGQLIRETLQSPPELGALSFVNVHAERKRRRVRTLVVAGSALASAAVFLLVIRAPESTALIAEGELWSSQAMDIAPEEPGEVRALKLERAPQEMRASAALADKEARPIEQKRRSASPGELAKVPTVLPPAATQEGANDVGSGGLTPSDSSIQQCAEMTQAGQYDSASSCYAMVSRSGGASAELAQLEQVRVLHRALGQPLAALASLEEYARRFPQGALRGEAALTKLGLLASTGQKKRLIQEVDKLLLSNWVPERKAELHLIKAEALVEEGHCSGALQAVQASEDAGGNSKRLAHLREQCEPVAE